MQHNKLHRCRSCCLLLTVRPHWDTSDTHTHIHTPHAHPHNKCPCARYAAAAYFGTFLFAWQPPTRLSFPSLAMTLTIALCAVCYFYRGDIYATCSHLIHAPLDMIHAQPNILIIRTDIARRQEAGQGRGRRGEVCLLQGCCSFWGALRTVSPDMACNLYFKPNRPYN